MVFSGATMFSRATQYSLLVICVVSFVVGQTPILKNKNVGVLGDLNSRGDSNREQNRQHQQQNLNQAPPGKKVPPHVGVGDSHRAKLKKHPSLADSEECREDVNLFCADRAGKNNFVILDCLQNDEKRQEKLSTACQHHLWVYKQNLTLDDKFDKATNEDCAKELKHLSECGKLPEGKGERIPCLIEYFDEVNSKTCKNFLNKMASIVFSDYRFMSFFMNDCKQDIEQLMCGRMEDEEDDSPHSQGKTVDCLSRRRKELSKICKKALLRVAEFQSDDYHLDRPLYYACKGDREVLCHDVDAGDGAVFKCLYKNLGNKLLTESCREKLEERQDMIAEDVKIDKSFYIACKADIKAYQCNGRPGGDTAEVDLKRSSVMLCLENIQNEGKKLHGECVKQMFELRTELMQDYKISPELVASCETEISKLCDGLEPGGATIECLMAEAAKKNSVLKPGCQAQVATLLHLANPAENVKLDVPLQKACKSIIETSCRDEKPGDGNVITCLMENIDGDDDGNEMPEECEKHLYEIQYFASRDFKLDHALYKGCRKDAKELCHAQDMDNTWTQTPDQGPQIFACLHRHLIPTHAKAKKLSRGCTHEVIRVVRERSRRIQLLPEVEEKCRKDLVEHCSDDDEHTEKGGEMACLQDNLDQLLDAECKRIVSNFTEEEAEIPELDRILMKACMPMIKLFCSDILDNDAMPDQVLECLIKAKHSPDMKNKCAAGIEHHQLISLKDFHFNHKFREACQNSVKKLCANKKTKYDVIACLSEHVRNDTLNGAPHRVDGACRKQLKVEHLQRDESINLNPKLKDKCEADVKKFCAEARAGKGEVMECLKAHKRKLSKDCHSLLYKREQDEALLGDYALLRTCKVMIKEHCDVDDAAQEILDCLKTHKDDDDFDEGCRKVVVRRLIEQARDIRLDPHLQKACKMDISKFCSHEMSEKKKDEYVEGNVINCLKKHYGRKAQSLSGSCEREISSRMKEANMDIKQNPVLLKMCKNDIKRACLKDVKNVEKMDIEAVEESEGIFPRQGEIVECLKANFQTLMDEGCKKEVAYMIAEGRIDIHVDPLLHSTCQLNLNGLCAMESQGLGRQMSCLLNVLEDNPDSLDTNCRIMLQKRKELWEYAAKVAPPESLQEIMDQMATSPSRNYFLAVLFTVVGIIFIVGLTCGRVTKRVRAEVKNK